MPHPSHRRDFVRTLALGASAGTLLPLSPIRAEDEPPEAERPDAPKTEAEARMKLILARFGDHLDDDARKAVRAEVNAIVRRAEDLRKFPLANGDGPMPVFTPYREPLAE